MSDLISPGEGIVVSVAVSAAIGAILGGCRASKKVALLASFVVFWLVVLYTYRNDIFSDPSWRTSFVDGAMNFMDGVLHIGLFVLVAYSGSLLLGYAVGRWARGSRFAEKRASQ